MKVSIAGSGRPLRSVLSLMLLGTLCAAPALPQGAATAPTGAAGAPSSQPKSPPSDTSSSAPPAAQKPGPARSASYSLGVAMGTQLRASGVTAGAVNAATLAQGVRDALSGKAQIGEVDQTNINQLMSAAAETQHRAAAKFLAANAKEEGVQTTASGLQYKILTPGSGESPHATDQVTVNYRGTLLDGTEFDSSYKRGKPATFALNHVIPGWSEGVALMKPGAKHRLFVPPHLAYDLRPPPGSNIPPGSLLIFEVELVSAKPGPAIAAPAPQAQPQSETHPEPQPQSPPPQGH